jgi:imidazole glycerol-phosphate synthase subunit HisF
LKNIRIIPRLDIKSGNLVKGIHLEGLRVLGDPKVFAKQYYEQGADEILFIDIVASLYRRNNILDIVKRVSEHVFIPMTVGGGIRSVDDVQQVLRSGADKIAINTAAIERPALLREIAESFGSQCLVLNVEYMTSYERRVEVFTNNGRERSSIDALDWVKQALDLGIGEILLTSIQQEGTFKGYDLEFIATVSELSPVPVIACGGAGSVQDVVQAVQLGHADAVCMAGLLHYNRATLAQLRDGLSDAGVDVRQATLMPS